uniref:Uncharacterized protein n=1 Tax=Panagrolaimus sp. PS1159 TaxID=55785 RepID=A0AC35GT69_9BILA
MYNFQTRGPENHYHCHNRRWIWGLISVVIFFVLIGFCVLCCRLCLGICLCTAIANRATHQPRVNPYNQRTIYANDAIFLPPVPVYTMHTNLNPFPLQTKGYHSHGGRPGTF